MRLQLWVSHISLKPHVEWLCQCLWRAGDGVSPQGAHQQAKCHDGPHLPQDQGSLGISIRRRHSRLMGFTYGYPEK